MSNVNLTPGRVLKDALRKACRAHPAFEAWRIAHGHNLASQPAKADCEAFLTGHDAAALAACYALAGLGSPPPVAPVVPVASPPATPAPVLPLTRAPVPPVEAAPATVEAAPVASPPVEAEPVAETVDEGDPLAAIFDPVTPFLSNTLIDPMRDRALAALAAARREGEREGEARAASNVIALPSRNGAPVVAPSRKGKASFGSLIGKSKGGLAGLIVETWSPGSFAPPVTDNDYAWPTDATLALVSAINRGRNIWLTGPRGTGKTSWAEQFAARTGRPFVRIGFHKYIEPAALIGGKGLRDGSTVFEDGQLTAAVRVPGTIVLCDEPDLAPPAVLAFLQSAIDLRSIAIPETGEVVPFAPGVVIAFASNTGGNGDETGLYAGTVEQNAALQDRFAAIVPFGYMPPEIEGDRLASRLGIAPERVAPFATFAALTRQDVLTGRNGDAVSYRALAAWCEAILDGIAPDKAFAWCVTSKMRPAFAARVLELYRADFDEPAAVAALQGRKAPAKPSHAGAAFPEGDVAPGDDLLS